VAEKRDMAMDRDIHMVKEMLLSGKCGQPVGTTNVLWAGPRLIH